MKISELIAQVCSFDRADELMRQKTRTVDTVKCGNIEREVTRVAVTMFGTVDVIRQAIEWGAELLIVHEPLFGSNNEEIAETDSVKKAKLKILQESGLVVFRYHDHPHMMENDMIDCGTISHSGLKGHITGKPYWAVTSFELDEPLSAREIAVKLENSLDTRYIRIAGAPNVPGKHIAFACGTPGHIEEALSRPDIDFIVTGEICEWAAGEFVRDLAQLGGGKAILVLGHGISERCGMKQFAKRLESMTGFETRYLESGALYTYTD